MSPQDFENMKNYFRPSPYDRTYVCREKSFGISHKHAYQYVFYKIISKKNNSITELSAPCGKFFLNHFFTHVEFDLNYELTTSYIRTCRISMILDNY